MGKTSYSKVQGALLSLFDRSSIDATAKRTGFLKRRRKILPFELILSAVAAFGRGRSSTFAQFWREYSRMTGSDVAYKPFHNQLAKPEFETFVEALAYRAMETLNARACIGATTAMRKFDDILVQDGTGFCVHDELEGTFPRRFGRWGGDAAIEVHATMSLLSDQLTRVALTPDTAPERPHLPAPHELKNKLILGDRGYQDHAYGVAVKAAGGHVLIRCQTPNPQTCCFWRDGKKVKSQQPQLFKSLLSQHPDSSFDLNANYPKTGLKFRTVSLWIPERCSRVTLMTTLPRRSYSATQVGELYRTRWQIELLFKEMKSHAGLGKWVTRKASLVRATVWLSVLTTLLKRFLTYACGETGGRSTLRSSQILSAELPALLRALREKKTLRCALKDLLTFLSMHGARAHRRRDKVHGRYSFAFSPVP